MTEVSSRSAVLPCSSCPSEDELRRFAVKESREAPAIAAHLDSCHSCSHYVAALNAETANFETDTDAAATSAWGDSLPPFVSGPQHPDVSDELIDSAADLATLLPERYQVLGRLARGGMGEVLRVQDTNLGRDLAIKVLLPQFAQRDEFVRRFRREAAITGALQHPGIPPVVELGVLGDGAPFFSMKLVEGETLEEQLRGRTAPDDRLSHFLNIFLQVAQTLAYAHGRQIIHRDLKPHNIMVGSFGEVQVMDWGLAKSLESIEDASEETSDRVAEEPFATEATSAGRILGTLAYMPPEQARGEIDSVDQRADVFGLGAILCQILTGQPPYSASDQRKLIEIVAAGDSNEALARLESQSLDPELTALVRRCLDAAPENRPQDAAVVAGAVEHYLHTTEARARRAELEVAEQQARAQADRKRRRVQWALAASILSTVIVIVGVTAWMIGSDWLQTAVRNEQLREVLDQAEHLHQQVVGQPMSHPAIWLQAQDRVARAVAIRDSGTVDEQLALRVEEMSNSLQSAERDRELVKFLEENYLQPTMDYDGQSQWWSYTNTMKNYREGFARFGLVADQTDLQAGAARIRSRPATVQSEIIASLSDWLQVAVFDGDSSADWIVGLLFAVEDDPWRRQLWTAIRARDGRAVGKLVEGPEVEQQHPRLVSGLARDLLWRYEGTGEIARRLLQRYVRSHSQDYWINLVMGKSYIVQPPMDPQKAVRYFTAALALREDPAAYDGLGFSLLALGQADEARHCARRSLELNDENSYAHYLLARTSLVLNEVAASRAAALRALQIDPSPAPYYVALAGTFFVESGMRTGRGENGVAADWIAAYRAALPEKHATGFADMAVVDLLLQSNRLDDAAKFLQTAVKANPGLLHGAGHLPGTAIPPFESLEFRGLSPSADRLASLASLYAIRGDFSSALAAYRQAVDLNPRHPIASDQAVDLLNRLGRPDVAFELLSHLEELRENDAWVADWQAFLSYYKGDLEAAIRFSKTAIARDSSRPNPHRFLASASAQLQRWEQAAEAFQTMLDTKQAIEAQDAARAVTAFVVAGTDPETTATPERKSRWRHQALQLLNQLTRNASSRLYLKRLLADPNLATVRDDIHLAQLPENEQQDWQQFWSRIRSLNP